MDLIRLCNEKEVHDNEIKSFDVNGRHIILLKRDGQIHALDGICTHAHYDLAEGFLQDNTLTCPLHLSSFDIRTGRPTNPPATMSLKSYKVKVEGNDVFVEV